MLYFVHLQADERFNCAHSLQLPMVAIGSVCLARLKYAEPRIARTADKPYKTFQVQESRRTIRSRHGSCHALTWLVGLEMHDCALPALMTLSIGGLAT